MGTRKTSASCCRAHLSGAVPVQLCHPPAPSLDSKLDRIPDIVQYQGMSTGSLAYLSDFNTSDKLFNV
jgi:hypothetical protein